MRIEKLGNNSYAKVLDKTESEVAIVINKYFNSTIFEDNAKNSREAIVQEITRRIEPLIMNLAETIAYKSIQEYVTGELSGYIDGKIIELMSSIKQIQLRIDKRDFKIGSADDKKVVSLPQDYVIDISKDKLDVFVNGGLQQLEDNYELIMDSERPTKVAAINFGIIPDEGDILEVDDVITLKAFIYSSLS